MTPIEVYRAFSKFARPCKRCGCLVSRPMDDPSLCDKCDPPDVAGSMAAVMEQYRARRAEQEPQK